MKVLLGGVVVVLIAILSVALLTNAYTKEVEPVAQFEDGLSVYTEETCTESFENRECVENTYVQCNGNLYMVPEPATKTYYKTEYIEKPVAHCDFEDVVKRAQERESPADRITDKNVHVSSNRIVITIQNPLWRNYIDSNSMDPFIDEGTTTLEVRPQSPQEIKVGDIIAYDVDFFEYAIVHRVTEIGEDVNGTYFITKGDNYELEDPYKVRFDTVQGIVIGILY